MKFNCKQVIIEHDEFGCTVTFYEKKDQYEDGVSIDKIMASQGQYILLQRTYGEDDFEDDYYYVEMSDFDKSGDLRHFNIDLYRNCFMMNYKNETIEININISDRKFEKLKTALNKIVNKNSQIKIHEKLK